MTEIVVPDERPEPLVPKDVDLSDFNFMPLEIRRLLTSETWIEAADDPKIGHALISLWAECWHQRPAGSLPNNEKVLARLAMCSPDDWARVRGTVMASWILCSDDLYYHPTVCEKVLDSWEKKESYRDFTEQQSVRGKRGAEARWGKSKTGKKKAKTRQLKTDGAAIGTGNGAAIAGASSKQMLGDGLKREGEEQGEGEGEKEDLRSGAGAPLSAAPTTPPQPDRPDINETIKTAFALYNKLAKEIEHPIAEVLSPERRAALRQRLHECGGIDGWKTALAKAEASNWMRGENGRGWRFDLDFLLQKSRFIKLMEGSYDNNRASAGQNASGSSLRDAAARLVQDARDEAS